MSMGHGIGAYVQEGETLGQKLQIRYVVEDEDVEEWWILSDLASAGPIDKQYRRIRLSCPDTCLLYSRKTGSPCSHTYVSKFKILKDNTYKNAHRSPFCRSPIPFGLYAA